MFFLCVLLPDSASRPVGAHTQSVTSKVGEQAVLPCSWKSRLGETPPSTCHVQWRTPEEMVFELRGDRRWQAEELEGRLGVPEESLGSGDCSLIISDVQIGDAGRYESFMVVDGLRSRKSRVFIDSVRLLVFGQSGLRSGFSWSPFSASVKPFLFVLDHKLLESRAPGTDLILDLHTSQSLTVVFQGRNSSHWSNLWTRGDDDSERLQKDPVKEQLTIRKLRSRDQGTYKVLDKHGLAVSTVQLSVEGQSADLQPEL